MTPQQVRERIEELRENGAEIQTMEPAEEFDGALVGIVERFHDTFALYSKQKVLEATLDETDEEPFMSALENYEFNIVGGWVGEGTPGFLLDTEDV